MRQICPAFLHKNGLRSTNHKLDSGSSGPVLDAMPARKRKAVEHDSKKKKTAKKTKKKKLTMKEMVVLVVEEIGKVPCTQWYPDSSGSF
mmetsp:Transcript_13140/g.21083  ORF Transcript_13140/g.21083 Transcript_13140/m.21083 type:complete len:89 (+) Transcript_13140:1-267(+)